MKKQLITLSLILLILIPLGARNSDLRAYFTPQRIWLNSLNTASFDPSEPSVQPILTTLTITNQGEEATIFLMDLQIKWNQTDIISKQFRSKEALDSGQPLTITNRDLITKEASSDFVDMGGDDIDLNTILKNPSLKQAVLSGYFPDGDLTLAIKLKKDEPGSKYGDPVVFTITVRNTGVINQITPGVVIGNTPSQQSMKPVSFVWNAMSTGFNLSWITIREFSPQSPPKPGSVANTGTLFYETPDKEEALKLANSFNFNEFLPFQDNHYYAWQITMDRWDERNPNLDGPNTPPSKRRDDKGAGNTLKSNWFVFKFEPDASTGYTSDELKAVLLQMNNQQIENAFNAGFNPTGLVQADGRSYSGQEAIRLVEDLLGKSLEIKISE